MVILNSIFTYLISPSSIVFEELFINTCIESYLNCSLIISLFAIKTGILLFLQLI